MAETNTVFQPTDEHAEKDFERYLDVAANYGDTSLGLPSHAKYAANHLKHQLNSRVIPAADQNSLQARQQIIHQTKQSIESYSIMSSPHLSLSVMLPVGFIVFWGTIGSAIGIYYTTTLLNIFFATTFLAILSSFGLILLASAALFTVVFIMFGIFAAVEKSRKMQAQPFVELMQQEEEKLQSTHTNLTELLQRQATLEQQKQNELKQALAQAKTDPRPIIGDENFDYMLSFLDKKSFARSSKVSKQWLTRTKQVCENLQGCSNTAVIAAYIKPNLRGFPLLEQNDFKYSFSLTSLPLHYFAKIAISEIDLMDPNFSLHILDEDTEVTLPDTSGAINDIEAMRASAGLDAVSRGIFNEILAKNKSMEKDINRSKARKKTLSDAESKLSEVLRAIWRNYSQQAPQLGIQNEGYLCFIEVPYSSIEHLFDGDGEELSGAETLLLNPDEFNFIAMIKQGSELIMNPRFHDAPLINILKSTFPDLAQDETRDICYFDENHPAGNHYYFNNLANPALKAYVKNSFTAKANVNNIVMDKHKDRHKVMFMLAYTEPTSGDVKFHVIKSTKYNPKGVKKAESLLGQLLQLLVQVKLKYSGQLRQLSLYAIDFNHGTYSKLVKAIRFQQRREDLYNYNHYYQNPFIDITDQLDLNEFQPILKIDFVPTVASNNDSSVWQVQPKITSNQGSDMIFFVRQLYALAKFVSAAQFSCDADNIGYEVAPIELVNDFPSIGSGNFGVDVDEIKSEEDSDPVSSELASGLDSGKSDLANGPTSISITPSLF